MEVPKNTEGNRVNALHNTKFYGFRFRHAFGSFIAQLREGYKGTLKSYHISNPSLSCTLQVVLSSWLTWWGLVLNSSP